MNEKPSSYSTFDDTSCQACEPAYALDTNYCGKLDETETQVCTRERGHNGNHIACGILTHGIKYWENQQQK